MPIGKQTLELFLSYFLFGFFVTTPIEFYYAAGFIGLGMGGIQSLSRSTFSKLIDVVKVCSLVAYQAIKKKCKTNFTSRL